MTSCHSSRHSKIAVSLRSLTPDQTSWYFALGLIGHSSCERVSNRLPETRNVHIVHRTAVAKKRVRKFCTCFRACPASSRFYWNHHGKRGINTSRWALTLICCCLVLNEYVGDCTRTKGIRCFFSSLWNTTSSLLTLRNRFHNMLSRWTGWLNIVRIEKLTFHSLPTFRWIKVV